jgi:hypothetical protein
MGSTGSTGKTELVKSPCSPWFYPLSQPWVFLFSNQFPALQSKILTEATRGILPKFVENCCFLRDSLDSRISPHTIPHAGHLAFTKINVPLSA